MAGTMVAPGTQPIPDGWQRVRLGDVAEFQQGGTPAKANAAYWDGYVPFVTGADLGQRRIGRDSARSFLTEGGLKSGSTAICNAGDLLLATRTRVGLVGIASEMLGASQDITLVEPKDAADCSFLYRVLDSRADELLRKSRGTTIQGVTREDVQGLPILLPPLPEQRAIAAVLDSIDDAIDGAEAVIAATDGLRDALLHDLLTRGLPSQHTEFRDFPGLGTIPADWGVVRLGDVAEVQTGRAVNKKAVADGELKIPYLSVANVKDGYLDLRIVKTMLVSNTDVERYGLKKGDVLFTEGGDADKLGRGSVWGGEISPCLHQNHVFAVRPSADVLIPDFLSSFASSGFGKRYFLGAAKQTTNLASVNSTQLKEMTLALPNIREQRKIVGAVSAMGVSIQEATVERDNLRLLKVSAAAALLTGRMRMGQ